MPRNIPKESETLFNDVILPEFTYSEFTLDNLKQSHDSLIQSSPRIGGNDYRKKHLDYLAEKGWLNKNLGIYSVNYQSVDVQRMVINDKSLDENLYE